MHKSVISALPKMAIAFIVKIQNHVLNQNFLIYAS